MQSGVERAANANVLDRVPSLVRALPNADIKAIIPIAASHRTDRLEFSPERAEPVHGDHQMLVVHAHESPSNG
jgi:hypothetical protein